VTIIDPGVKYEPEADYHVFDQGEHDCFVCVKPMVKCSTATSGPIRLFFPISCGLVCVNGGRFAPQPD